VSGGVIENCDRAPEVASHNFGSVGHLPLVLDTLSNLPAVVYQSSKDYCVLYSFFNMLVVLSVPESFYYRVS
jgi:hypothetical protein